MLKKNNNFCNEECFQHFSKFVNQFYQIPELDQIDLIENNFFQSKINNFKALVSSYIEACKAPRKCTLKAIKMSISCKNFRKHLLIFLKFYSLISKGFPRIKLENLNRAIELVKLNFNINKS